MGAGAIPIDIEKAFRQREHSTHTLQVYTAPFDYDGEDRVDVSFNSGNVVLNPPRHQLFDYRLGRLSSEQFRLEYGKFLEASFLQNKYNWDNMLDSQRIVLVCSCNVDGPACHRHFLIEFLQRFGAVYRGALVPKKTKLQKKR